MSTILILKLVDNIHYILMSDQKALLISTGVNEKHDKKHDFVSYEFIQYKHILGEKHLMLLQSHG